MLQSNKLSLILWLSLLTSLSLACQRFVDLQPNAEPLMAVTSFVQANDSLVQVEVYRQQVVGQTGGLDYRDFILSDARVSLRNLSQDQPLTLSYDPEQARYLGLADPSFLQAKDSLELIVTHPGFPDIKAICVIPAAPQGLEVKLDSTFDNWPVVNYFIETSWEDDPLEENFYRVIGKIIEGPFWVNPDEVFFRWSGLDANADYLTDQGQQGQRIEGPNGDLQNVARQLSGVRPPPQAGDSVRVQLLNVDVNYYEFMLDLREARFADVTFSEPYQIYSNLEGGVGVFAAYHQVEAKLRVR